MAEITAALVKELREKTGAGMMDAKKALVENNGDQEAAIEWLRVMAILVVVLVHAAQVFSPWQTWHVQNVERSSALGALTVSAWPWVMHTGSPFRA